ncbi:MAG: type I secretion system permease/ATPase [Alphaproteobacteria bacterium]|nr:type I secretion system permease/ATPase [Alphaproteobacteria bacterium]MCB9985924.1 type I secretion system permease/ATPase [Micavibrio sp.]
MTSKVRPYDPLLECLSHLTAVHGHSKSAESLKAGLAYDGIRVDPAQCIEAAERVGFKVSKVQKRELKNITESTLPALILLKRDECCVLKKIKKETATIWDHKTRKDKEVPLKDLTEIYAGSLILLKPKPDFIDPSLRVDRPAYSWLWDMIRQNRNLYKKMFFASVLINIFALVSPVYIMNVYDRVIPNNALETGWALAIGAVIVFTFDFFIRTLRGYFTDFAGRNVDVRLTRMLFDRVLDMKFEHRPTSSGSFASMLKETESIREFMASATIATLVDLPFAFLFLLVIYSLGGWIGLIVLFMMILSVVAALILQIPIKKYVGLATRTAETKHGLLVETIYGLETLKSLGADGRLRKKYAAHVSENANVALKSRHYSALSVNISTWVQQCSSVVIVLVGMYLIKEGNLSMGALIACVILSGRALGPITQVANLISRVHHTSGAIRALNKIMSAPQERPAGKEFLYRPDLKGNIRFNKVSFSYPSTTHNVLEAVSFDIKSGEKIGIIGRIGSGKSTVSKLLMKLYEPTEGSILVDGTDYLQIDPSDLRRNIGYIAQDITLFRGTIRDNIATSVPDACEEEILRCAKLAGAHDFISTHPLGYGAQVGERGDGLSGGQKQCIALARALLLNPEILICDEPTNAMDIQTEQNFIHLIANQPPSQTLLLITHRTSLLPLVNRLILIENGQIIMDDTRDAVLDALKTGKIGGQAE